VGAPLTLTLALALALTLTLPPSTLALALALTLGMELSSWTSPTGSTRNRRSRRRRRTLPQFRRPLLQRRSRLSFLRRLRRRKHQRISLSLNGRTAQPKVSPNRSWVPKRVDREPRTAAYRQPSTTHHPPPTAHRPPPTAHRSPPTRPIRRRARIRHGSDLPGLRTQCCRHMLAPFVRQYLVQLLNCLGFYA